VRNIFICSGVVFWASSAPHVGQRSHLDGAGVEEPAGPVGAHHVVEGVVQRPEVGVDFGHEITGQEPEALARFDRRAGQDDAVHLLGLQRLDPQGDRQITLAGARRPYPEGHHAVADGIRVPLLPTGLGAHRTPPRRSEDLRRQHLRGPFVRPHHVDSAVDDLRVEELALLEEQAKLVDQPGGQGRVLAIDGELITPGVNHRALEGVLHQPQVLVQRTDESGHQVIGDGDGDGRGHGETPHQASACRAQSIGN
jgi:hypothetical protein